MSNAPQPPPPPEFPVHTSGDAKAKLSEGVHEALSALPAHFKSATSIESVNATDLFALNTLLGTTIEQQVVASLNALRGVWDPNDQWQTYRFERQPQTFPDVRLISRTRGQITVALGIELKGWYLLSKEGVPSLRFVTTRSACDPYDLICVVPWHLASILAGSPVVLEPWVQSARYAADSRNYYWQYLRGTNDDTTISSPVASPYPTKDQAIQDVPAADGGGNFGRLARVTGLMDDFIERSKQSPLLGITAEHWIAFFKQYSERSDPMVITARLQRDLARATSAGSDAAALRIIDLLYELKTIL